MKSFSNVKDMFKEIDQDISEVQKEIISIRGEVISGMFNKNRSGEYDKVSITESSVNNISKHGRKAQSISQVLSHVPYEVDDNVTEIQNKDNLVINTINK